MKGFEKDLFLSGDTVAFQAAAACMESLCNVIQSRDRAHKPYNGGTDIHIADKSQHRALQRLQSVEGV